jgi:hypothetical protein
MRVACAHDNAWVSVCAKLSRPIHSTAPHDAAADLILLPLLNSAVRREHCDSRDGRYLVRKSRRRSLENAKSAGYSIIA